ncbi:type II toxin-antitoxin system RelB/DinJ family antitoxin [Flavobacterium sp.]|jgi:DNA-damage-inducible protein J|uniref:type II toxin-antitoxin system RelB/DinJ family antitoxin n=1 Tax=Flavobacterium sp. TaxID=239 RepID=UPI0037C0D749
MSYMQDANQEKTMTANSVVRARINDQVKQEAAAVLKAMGLTASDAFRMMMTRIAAEKSLPFEPLVPNPTTIAAMKEARAGNLKSFATVQDMLADLDADD